MASGFVAVQEGRPMCGNEAQGRESRSTCDGPGCCRGDRRGANSVGAGAVEKGGSTKESHGIGVEGCDGEPSKNE